MQVPHLAFLGVRVADERQPSRYDGEEGRRKLLRSDGVPMDWNDREELGATLCRGLLDRTPQTDLRTCLHLFRTVAADMPGSVRTDVDGVTSDLLAALGVSVPWLLMLSSFLDDAAIKLDGHKIGAPDIDMRGNAQDDEPMLWADIALGGDLIWSGDCVKFKGAMPPDTVMNVLEGMPLRAVVSHPVLDRYDLTVREVEGPTVYTGYVPMIRIADRLRRAA